MLSALIILQILKNFSDLKAVVFWLRLVWYLLNDDVNFFS